mgnify:CR=1 FL=1
MSYTMFYMWEGYRQRMIAEHNFYVEQAQKRLLTQFDNMEAEADKATEEYLDKMSTHFNPDIHDPSDFYEAAYDKGIEFYQLLSELLENTRLNVIAGMFHQWDKSLRDWIVNEVRHWHRGENLPKAIWKVDFPAITGFLAAVGFDVRQFPCYEQLNAMRLVVNVFKHGNGSSLDDLQKLFPQFFPNPLGGCGERRFPFSDADHTDMKVSDVHLKSFSGAILDFWQAVPERIFDADNLCTTCWPKALKDAWEKDGQ